MKKLLFVLINCAIGLSTLGQEEIETYSYASDDYIG